MEQAGPLPLKTGTNVLSHAGPASVPFSSQGQLLLTVTFVWSHQILYRRATGRCLDSLLAHGWHCCLLLKDELPHDDARVAVLPIVQGRMCCMLLGGRLWSYLWVRRWAWVFWTLPTRASGSFGGHGPMSCCIASAWVALLSIAKRNCLMMMLGLQCCLLCRDVCAACFWADVCGLTFGSVGERGSFGRYLRELPGPSVAMGRCLVALLVLGW